MDNTINQGTEKHRDTNLKLLTWTMGILVSLGTDFFVEIRRSVQVSKRILRNPLTLKLITQ